MVPASLFMGNAVVGVGPGGRLSLPGFVSKALTRRGSDREIVLGMHEFEPCLIAFDPEYQRALHMDLERRRRLDESPAGQADYASRARRLFASAVRIPVRENARIALPRPLALRAAISGEALILGAGGAIEIWSPDLAARSADPALRDLAAFAADIPISEKEKLS